MSDRPTSLTQSLANRYNPDLLGIYLNDHLAGATAGTELARRAAAALQHDPAGSGLEQISTDIASDRAALIEMMKSLRIPVRSYKAGLGWLTEKAGRLKLNGRLATRSPLSTLEEIEMLKLGVEGKAAGWRALRVLADRDARLDAARLDVLLVRASEQAERLEELRVKAADQLIRTAQGLSG